MSRGSGPEPLAGFPVTACHDREFACRKVMMLPATGTSSTGAPPRFMVGLVSIVFD